MLKIFCYSHWLSKRTYPHCLFISTSEAFSLFSDSKYLHLIKFGCISWKCIFLSYQNILITELDVLGTSVFLFDSKSKYIFISRVSNREITSGCSWCFVMLIMANCFPHLLASKLASPYLWEPLVWLPD